MNKTRRSSKKNRKRTVLIWKTGIAFFLIFIVFAFIINIQKDEKTIPNETTQNDTTDPDNNSVNESKPTIKVKDTSITVEPQNSLAQFLKEIGVKAEDTDGNDITNKVIVSGINDFSKSGKYILKLNVTDDSNKSADEVTLTVVINEKDTQSNPEDEKIPIYYVETESKVVSLTINSAWNIDDLDEILDILDKNDIKSTFFVAGDWVNQYPDELKKLYERGHEIANHAESHKNMSTLSKEECIKEIESVHNKVYELIGVEMNLFRPPSGDYDAEVVLTAASIGYYTIQWNIDSLDWKNYGVEDMIERVVNNKKLCNGSIILLHNGTKYTKDALQGIIDGLRNKGYEFKTISELIYKDNYTVDKKGMQKLK